MLMPSGSHRRRTFLKACGATSAQSISGCLDVRRFWIQNDSPSPDDWPKFSYDQGNTGYNPRTRGPTSDGSIRWTFDVDGHAVSSSPAVVDGTVYVGGTGSSGNLLAIDATDGTQVWQYDTVGYLTSGPAIVGSVVFIADSTGRVDAITTGGDRIWRQSLGGRNLDSAPVVADGTVYVGTAGPTMGSQSDGTGTNRLFALDATDGEVRWTAPASDWVTTAPTVSDETVFFGDDGGTLYALDRSTSEERWRFETGYAIASAPAVADGRVYFGVFHPSGTTSSRVYVLDASSGTVDWTFDAVPPQIATSPAVTDKTVFVGCYGPPPGPTECNRYECDDGSFGLLYALDKNDGTLRWKRKTVPDLRSSPAVTDEAVYYGRGNGIEAADPTDGTLLWEVDFGKHVASSPAVSNGWLFVGCSDGNVYAIAEQDE